MSTFLFDSIVFGPVKSRRMGISLGINLLPKNAKVCTYDCIYCECGWTECTESNTLPNIDQFKKELGEAQAKMEKLGITPDAITFAGNGEPTIHPQFPQFVEETVRFREQYYPDAKITLLSNASNLHNKDVVKALEQIDQVMLKLDCGSDEMFQKINKARKKYSLNAIHSKIKSFKGPIIIQSLFVRGEHDGEIIDNSSDEEIKRWIERLEDIHPVKVIIYSIARNTPSKKLEAVPHERLMEIAEEVEKHGIVAEVY